MTFHLDLADIQCNVLRDLGSGFPKSRFIFIHIPDGKTSAARAFLQAYRGRVTNALRWSESGEPNYPGETVVPRPVVAVNLAISWDGLRLLGVPHRTLAGMPPEFIDGMMARARILGDQAYTSEDPPPKNTAPGTQSTPVTTARPDTPAGWDAAWLGPRAHIMVVLNTGMDAATGQPVPELHAYWSELKQKCDDFGLEILRGHGGNSDALYQDASLLLEKNKDGSGFTATAREHFGFTDGFGNPVFEGQHGFADATHVRGNGKMVARSTRGYDWKHLATGEFLLGYADEGQELPTTALPASLMRNGTFLVYRKLHENVGSFNKYFDEAAKEYAAYAGIGEDDARAYLKAKMTGRWSDGIPIAVAPTIEDWRKLQAELAAGFSEDITNDTAKKARRNALLERIFFDFRYGDDPDGLKCPVSSHLRRVNTRDSMQPVGAPGSELNNRRRILRRGAPYGETKNDDDSEHGIVFMALCANIQRQFEFILQQWLQYGLDSGTGNDDCPLLGARLGGDKKFIIPVDPKGDQAPFICTGLPKFVETRGGEYFFLPSLTALRMIGMGVVDPT